MLGMFDKRAYCQKHARNNNPNEFFIHIFDFLISGAKILTIACNWVAKIHIDRKNRKIEEILNNRSPW